MNSDVKTALIVAGKVFFLFFAILFSYFGNDGKHTFADAIVFSATLSLIVSVIAFSYRLYMYEKRDVAKAGSIPMDEFEEEFESGSM